MRTLWATLTQTRRLYDRLGPGPMLNSFLGQHQLIHHLLHSGAAGQWHKQLRVLDSVLAADIGVCLVNLLGAPDVVRAWSTHARNHRVHSRGHRNGGTHAEALHEAGVPATPGPTAGCFTRGDCQQPPSVGDHVEHGAWHLHVGVELEVDAGWPCGGCRLTEPVVQVRAGCGARAWST